MTFARDCGPVKVYLIDKLQINLKTTTSGFTSSKSNVPLMKWTLMVSNKNIIIIHLLDTVIRHIDL